MGKFDKVGKYSLTRYVYYQIDEDFREIIRKLNNKNYGTSFCCQGHTDRLKKEKERWNAHIYFRRGIDVPKSIPIFENQNGDNPYCIIEKNAIDWYSSANSSFEQKEQERQELLAQLNEWVDSLEPREIQQEWYYYITGISKKTNKKKWLYANSEPLGETELKELLEKKSKYYDDIECCKYITKEW